jgi:periplasmic divalent cation tolerance protein
MSKINIITTTFDSEKTCTEFANKIIIQKLAACCQISKIQSMYLWKGKPANESEFKLDCKTLNPEKLVEFLSTNHPYDIPEILIKEVECNQSYHYFVASCK